MATQKRLDELVAASYAAANDYLVVVRDPASVQSTNTITIGALFGNVAVDAVLTANVTIDTNTGYLMVNNFIVTNKSTPSANNDTVVQGSIWFDDDYIYVATANNQIKRASLANFS